MTQHNTPSTLADVWGDPDGFLRVLIAIHQWESEHMDMLQTMTGRTLYFQLVEELLTKKEYGIHSLKAFTGHMTERAMRGRIREFEKMGLISVEQNETDARTRTLVPTEKFVAQFELHAAHIQHLLQSNYILIPK